MTILLLVLLWFLPPSTVPCVDFYTFLLILASRLAVANAENGLAIYMNHTLSWLDPAGVAHIFAAIFLVFGDHFLIRGRMNNKPIRSPAKARKRRSVRSIFDELGPMYTARAYRMDEADFWHLHKMLHTNLGYSVKPKRTSTKKNRNGAPNGLIHSAIRLSIALRFFAGGSAYDIALVHGVSYVEVYRSVWRVVDAVNQCAELQIQYPSDHQAQKDIAQGFQCKSSANFDCCVGAIPGSAFGWW